VVVGELFVEAEAAGEDVGGEDGGVELPAAEEDHGDEVLLHVDDGFGAAAGDVAAWEFAGLLGEVHAVEAEFGTPEGPAGEGAGGGFGAHHADVVEQVAV